MLLMTGLPNLIQGQDGHDTLSGMPKPALVRWPAGDRVHLPENRLFHLASDSSARGTQTVRCPSDHRFRNRSHDWLIKPTSLDSGAWAGINNRVCLPLVISFPAMLNRRYRHRFTSHTPASWEAGKMTSCIHASRFVANAAISAHA